MQITSGKVVFIDYTLTDDDQEVIDFSRGGEPLGYVHGAGQIVPGLEKALEGKRAGESLKVVVEPGEAYGFSDPKNIAVIPASQIEAIDELAEGSQLEAEGGQIVVVTKIEGDEVTIDANHPLAGLTLHFDVTVREVRDADPDEISHGHVHGAGGHHH